MTEPLDPQAAKLIAAAPLPTRKTLKRRKNVFFQFFRFIRINLKMMRVIRHSH
ncbi:MAG: hypothetical protein FWD29_07255 [Micrococcales bacterium]|nr:hypothetical protein [Micrococcales bacterium]